MGRPFPTKALIFANLGVLCAAAWGLAEPGIIAVTIIALLFVDGVVILKWQYAKSATSNQKRETSKFSSTVQKLLVANLIHWEFPRLCRGGSRSLTVTAVHRGNS